MELKRLSCCNILAFSTTNLKTNMHKHLSHEQRYQIYALLKADKSQKEIARILGVHPSTICREIKRNRGLRGYRPGQASRMARERKSQSAKNNARKVDSTLLSAALEWVGKHKWSPRQIAGSLRVGLFPGGAGRLSHETIYKAVVADKNKGGTVWTGLRRKRKKYNRRTASGAGRGLIPNRRDIELRPAEVETREQVGHWEADTVIGTKSKGEVLVTVVERSTRMLFAGKAESKTSEAVTKELCRLLKSVSHLVLSITFDNGKEFAGHQYIARELNCECYFAKPYHSWERGSNERTNGLVRQFAPKGVPLENYSPEFISAMVDNINKRPMALLGYQSPEYRFSRAIAASSTTGSQSG